MIQNSQKMNELKFYKKPFTLVFTHVYDKDNNFVFQFIPRYDSGNQYREGFLKLIDKVVNSLNSDEHLPIEELSLSVSEKDPNIIMNGIESFIMIRGWGNLTGANKFSPEKAADIQDSFRDWIIEKVSVKK